jgi:hypothetical protein
LLAAALLLAPAAAQALSFFDGVFDPADWSVMIGGSGASTPVQMLAGGNPDEYFEITNEPTPVPGTTVQGFHLHSSFVYDPGISGAIASIEWSLDVLNVDFGHAAGLAIVQGPTMTGADVFVTAPLGFGSWVSTGPTLLSPSDLSVLLDVSSSGAPLTFGIFSANSYDPVAGDLDNVVGYDNLSITVTPVPEPSALALVGAGLVAVVLARRRSR